MSIASPFNAAGATPAHGPHPVVLRFAELFPHQIRRYRLHGDRKQRDMDHVDHERSPLNRPLIGDETWFETLADDIHLASLENVNKEAAGLRRAKRVGEAQKRLLEGPRDPWRKSKGGPLREVVITAHRDWFETPSESRKLFDLEEQEARERQFESLAVEWLKSRFGEQVIHARVDRDETTFHIHGIIAPWVEKTSKRSGRQRLLQPSSHPLLKDYEQAQDDIGAFFTELGLVRGERRAEARRKAKEARKTDPTVQVPEPRAHVPAHVWRAEEEVRLANKARELANAEAATTVARQQAAGATQDATERAKEAKAAIRQAQRRQRAAEEVIEIAGHVADGHLVPDADDRVVISPKLPSDDRRRQRLAQVLEAPAKPTRRLLARLQRGYRVLRSAADLHAKQELDARTNTVERAETALHGLRRAMLKAFPERLRGQFTGATMREASEADRAMRALRRTAHTGREESDR